MFELLKGMVMCSASGCRGVKCTAKRAYRSVKRQKWQKQMAKNHPKSEKKEGEKKRTGDAILASPDVPGDVYLCLQFPYVDTDTPSLFFCVKQYRHGIQTNTEVDLICKRSSEHRQKFAQFSREKVGRESTKMSPTRCLGFWRGWSCALLLGDVASSVQPSVQECGRAKNTGQNNGQKTPKKRKRKKKRKSAGHANLASPDILADFCLGLLCTYI